MIGKLRGRSELLELLELARGTGAVAAGLLERLEHVEALFGDARHVLDVLGFEFGRGRRVRGCVEGTRVVEER